MLISNISIRSAFTLVFSMCIRTTSGYRSHVNVYCKCRLSDFDCDMVAGAGWAGLSISETADLLGFSHI